MLPHNSKYGEKKLGGNLTCFNTPSNRNISSVLNILNILSSDPFFIIAHIILSFFSYLATAFPYITTNISLRKVVPFRTEAFSLKVASDFTAECVFKTDFLEPCLSKGYCKQCVPVMYTKAHYLNPRKIKF